MKTKERMLKSFREQRWNWFGFSCGAICLVFANFDSPYGLFALVSGCVALIGNGYILTKYS